MLTIGALRFHSNSIPGLLHQRALDFPADPSYLFPEKDQTCTWGSLWAEVQAVAAGLRRLGLQRHERVAILMEGRAEQLICLYAAIAAGGVAVPLSSYLTKDELKGYLREARPAVFILGSADHHLAYAQLADVVAETPGPAATTEARWIPYHAFVLGSPVPPGSAFRPYDALKAAAEPSPAPDDNAPALTAHDPAFLLFSSGTTGTSKAIVRSAASFMARNPAGEAPPAGAFQAFLARRGNAYVNRFCCLSLLPIYHLAGLSIALTPLLVCNVRVGLLARFNPVRGLEAIARLKAQFMIGTPHMVQAMLTLEQAATTPLDSVLGVFFASAALRPHVLEHTITRLRKLYFFSVSYGSTETGGVANGTCFLTNQRYTAVALLLRAMRRLNYLNDEIPLAAFTETTASIGGTISPQVEVGIRHPDTGAWLPEGQEGEILVRSHRLMPYQDESRNQAQAAAGGWFRTGDLGYVDAHRRIMITDRLKRVISRGGEKIAPAEIERVLKQQPGIEEALVLGIPDALYGETVGAAFTEKQGATVSVEALRDALQASLSRFKVPQHFLRLTALPLNASGKVAVAEIRAELEQMIQRGDA